MDWPVAASEIKRRMTRLEAFRLDINDTMQRAYQAARRGDYEEVSRLIGTCVAAASHRIDAEN